MALRIRKDGTILCAAMHPEKEDDTYLHDGLSYKLTVELRAIVTEPMKCEGGRGGHGKHGEWWWANEVPRDVEIEQRGKDPYHSYTSRESAWANIYSYPKEML